MAVPGCYTALTPSTEGARQGGWEWSVRSEQSPGQGRLAGVVRLLLVVVFAVTALRAGADQSTPGVRELLSSYPHARLAERSDALVVDHQIGLGALQKIHGDWEFRNSERLSGELSRRTFQIIDGFAASAVLEDVEAHLREQGAQLRFQCGGRACGHAAQWANRVFGQRILYGRADEQRYRVYTLSPGDSEWRVVLYAGARTSDRQYLHVDVLKVNAPPVDSAAELQ